MQTWPNKYNNQVCPFCRSKKLKAVGVHRFHPQEYEIAGIKRTGWLCDNCKRYHTLTEEKWAIDLAEMRRDMMQLSRFLESKMQ